MNDRPNSLHALDKQSLVHPYTNLAVHQETGPHVITGGDGIYVVDDEGKRYIEGLAGLFCAGLGFSEQRLVEAATRQLKTMPFYHSFAHKSTEPGIRLAEKLLSIAPVPMSKVFFAGSGSEANDTAIKLIWYYNNALGRPEKKKIISRRKAYHGVTVATASLTGLPFNHRDFDLPIANILHTDCPHYWRFAETGETEEDFATRMANNLEAIILEEGPETIAAFFAEPARRRHHPAENLFRKGPGGSPQIRYPAHRRRGDLRFWPHRQHVRLRNLWVKAGHDQLRQAAVGGLHADLRPDDQREDR